MQKQTIFFIDDDHEMRATIRDALEGEGYNVRTFSQGKDALSDMIKNPPDLIVIDLVMPIMNGEDFLKAKNSNPIHSHIPVIIISAYLNKLKLIDHHSHIKKPFDLNKFLHLVSSNMIQRSE